jgi:phosphoribosylglycinamide formyltransferase 1
MQKINIAIFASGAGSNADKICEYFKKHPDIRVSLIVSNRSQAGVLQIASYHEIESLVIPKSKWAEPNYVLHILREKEITHIVLAGFLLLLPFWFIEEFNGRIVNIHPALLPKYGGKGMYGMHVHEKVKKNGELSSGITIHIVDENYDNGDIIFQKKVLLDPHDSANDIAKKVLTLEHYHYPRVIEAWVSGKSLMATK